MTLRTRVLSIVVAVVAATVLPAVGAFAATSTTVTFNGTITSTMSVNNGTNTGSIPAGTPYTGTLSYDTGQAPAPAAFNGGTRTLYSFTDLTFTIGSSSAHSGPGTIMVNDNLTSAIGYPTGDSVYVNFAGVAPSGLLASAAFNWMGLAMLDPSGQAVTGGALPTSLNSAAFGTTFSEFNFGTRGTPWGAGNTSMIQSLTKVGDGVVTPPAITFAPSLPGGTVGASYAGTFAPATGGTGAFTYQASGLPDGLSLSGTTVSGVPTTAGTYPVTLTATDAAGKVATATVTVSIVEPAVACAGNTGVITSYVARDPGFIVVNGGLDLLDHLWTTNLDPASTTFLGGLTSWYQSGLVVSWTGAADPNGCILDHLTVSPAVKVSTSSLPSGAVGVAYSAGVSAEWGAAPYTYSVSGLPAGLGFDGGSIVGTPSVAGTFPVTVNAADSVGGTASVTLDLTIAAGGSYTVRDESKGKITAIAPDYSYLMVGTKKLIWDSSTTITVNTPAGERHVIDGFVKVGMKVQWKGLRDRVTNTVLTSKIEVN